MLPALVAGCHFWLRQCSCCQTLAGNCLILTFQRHRLLTMGSTRPHRKLVKHYHEPGDLHELTFSCYQRLPLLTNDAWRQRLARCMDLAGQQTGIELAAFVFMPEHVHLLAVPAS